MKNFLLPEKENEPDSVSETTNVSDKVIDDAEVSKKATPPVKPGKKRRNRELEVLQEDLKASWMCDGLMNTTSVRTCSQKNKTQDQPENQVEDHAKAGKDGFNETVIFMTQTFFNFLIDNFSSLLNLLYSLLFSV